MTVGHVSSSLVAGAKARQGNQRPPSQQYSIGQRLGLRVLRDLGHQRYLVAIGSSHRVVASTVPLATGSDVQATVAAVGDKLELKYLDARISDDSAVAAGANSELANLELRYAAQVRDADRHVIERAMSLVSNKVAMANVGLYLAKLALPVDDAGLQALYQAQQWPAPVDQSDTEDDARPDLDDIVAASSSMPAKLVTMFAEALDASAAEPETVSTSQVDSDSSAQPTQLESAEAQTSEDDSRRDLAHRLLNEQDDGSLAHRYGVLPVLIGDQLVELDLVYFHERRDAERAAGMRRLVMTFSTPTLGRVEILARAVGDRLSIGINAENPQSSSVLAAHADEVRELAVRLGWNVEVVSYEIGAEPVRGAQHVVDHVLNADILSRLA